MFWTILLVFAGSVAFCFATIFFLLVIAAVRSDTMINKCLLEKSFDVDDGLHMPHLKSLKQDEQEPSTSRRGLLNAG